MLGFFVIHFLTACGLSRIGNLPELYVLGEDELFTINLDNYFYGSGLTYEISPTTQTLLSPAYTDAAVVDGRIVVEMPEKISLIQTIFNPSGTNQLMLYKGKTSLDLFYVSLQTLKTIYLAKVTFNYIRMTQLYSKGLVNGAIVLADNPNTQLFFISISINYKPEKTVSLLDLSNITNPYISQGHVKDTLTITGYLECFPVMMIYNISNIYEINLIQIIYLSQNLTDIETTIMSVSVFDQHFAILSSSSELFSFELDDDGDFYIYKVLKLQYFEHNVTDFQVNLNKNYLVVGILGGFIICSFDFEQVFVQQEFKIFHEVYASYTVFNDYVLTKRNDEYFLYQLGPMFSIVGNMSLGLESEFFNWGVFAYYLPNCVFIASQNMDLLLYNITFSYPSLAFISSPTVNEYTLTVTQPVQFNQIQYRFKVKQPLNDTLGIIELYSNYSIEAYFSNFSSYFLIPLHNYIIGSSLTTESCNISIIDHTSYFISSTKIIPNFEHKASIFIQNNNYKYILGTEDYFFLYNSSTITTFNEDEEIYSIEFEDVDIRNLVSCGGGNGFLVYYESNSTSAFIYSPDYSFSNCSIKFIDSKCSSLMCSKKYVICLSVLGVYSFKLMKNDIGNSRLLPNSKFSTNVISSSLLQDSFMCVLLENNEVMIVDLDTYWLFDDQIVGPTIKLFFPGARILSSLNVFIRNLHNVVYMFDFTLAYNKKFHVLANSKLKLYMQYLISYTETQVLVIDTNQWETNSTIVNITLNDWEKFSGFSDSGIPLKLFFLNGSYVDIYEIPHNYNSIEVTIEINDFENISSVQYNGLIECNIFNMINSFQLSVLLNLMVNGETIYKNQTEVLEIQKENMDYQCGETFNLPLSRIFSGQDLSANITKTKYLSLSQRFTINYDLNSTLTCKTYSYSQNKQYYLGVTDCAIIIFDPSLTILSSLDFLDYRYNCSCYTISVLADYTDINFVIGCTVSESFIRGISNSDQFQNLLIFGSYSKNITILRKVEIDFPPQKMRANSLNGGEFVIVTAENYNIVTSNNFYSNHLKLTYGSISDNKVTIFSHSCEFSHAFLINYYYLTDFEVTYDPLFSIFYIYSLDIYYGLRIFKFNGLDCLPSGSMGFNNQNPAFSISLCGQHVFVGMKNTDIFIYNLRNFTNLEYSASILGYTRTSQAVQGSLRCSSNAFPNYLFIQMNDSNTFALHIIDFLSQNQSNILRDFNINNSFSDPPIFADFLNENGNLAIISHNTKAVYKLSSFNLLIDTTSHCKKNLKKEFIITVFNTKSKATSANFTIKVKKSYKPSKIKNATIPFWVLVTICIILLSTVLTCYFTIKKCIKKSRVSNNPQLFNYQNEFKTLTKKIS